MGAYTWAPGERPGAKHRNHHNFMDGAAGGVSGVAAAHIRYVLPEGSNVNDGQTWGTAKKDVVHAVTSLSAMGGKILVGQGPAGESPYWDSDHTDRGLWLYGYNDPRAAQSEAANAAEGWYPRKSLEIIGTNGQQLTQFNRTAIQTWVSGGSGTDRLKPAIWIAGAGGLIHFENLSYGYHAVSVRGGIGSDMLGTIDSSGVTFTNCGQGLNQIPGNGPAFELGYVYWWDFARCQFSANSALNPISSASRAGAVATFTTPSNHYMEVGDTVYISEVNPAGYNSPAPGVNWRITAVTPTTFTVTLPADPGAYVSGGKYQPVNSFRRGCVANYTNLYTDLVYGNQADAGLLTFQDCNFGGGGFYYRPSGNYSWGGVTIKATLQEGLWGTTGDPSLLTIVPKSGYFGNGIANAGGGIIIENSGMADTASGVTTVNIDAQVQNYPHNLVLAVNSDTTGASVLALPDFGSRLQAGIAKGSFVGKFEGVQREFSPASVRYANLANQTLSGGNWVTGQKAPDGTTNAASLTLSSLGGEYALFTGGHTVSVGDWIVAGVWRRRTTVGTEDNGNWPTVSHNSTARFNDGPNNYFELHGNNWGHQQYTEDSAWMWITEYVKVTTGGTGDFAMLLRCQGNNTIHYFAPICFRIPAADGLNEYEVKEMVRHLHTYPSDAPVGTVTAMRGQKIIAPAGIGVGNSAAATTPGSVVKKIEVFDAAGASLGFIPVYSSIT